MWRHSAALLIVICLPAMPTRAADEAPQFDRDILPLLKRHCVKCHGPARQEAKLNVASPSGLVRGGKNGSPIIPHDAEASLIWQRVSSNEMPPESPLSAAEKSLLKRWIVGGTAGLKRDDTASDSEHWAFRQLPGPNRSTDRVTFRLPSTLSSLHSQLTVLDSFVADDLARDGLALSAEADRPSLIRRVSFDLTGLPPTPDEVTDFSADARPDAYERLVDRVLASPHYGERLGKVWLDAAGYADSNGYFNADTDRPLAFRYRDYVIRAINSDMPFDQFVREQIAGDEIAGVTARNGEAVDFSPLAPALRGEGPGVRGAALVGAPVKQGTGEEPLSLSPQGRDEGRDDPERIIELLEATHYLRCGQDGTGESDGNPDEVRVDRYTVIETAMQNLSTGLLGLTIQCAKCHDHKFEPLTQRDYYSLQAVLIPAFPPDQWVKPNDRFVFASRPGEYEAWQTRIRQADETISRLKAEIADWVKQHRPRGKVLFADAFDGAPASLADSWSNTAPGDDAPGGTAAVKLNSREAPAAIIVDGQLQLIEGGPGGDKWLSTKQAFDWTPDRVGASMQVTFDLVDHHVGDSKPAERIGYFLALHDFNDNSSTKGGNILVDGHPSSSTAVFLDYPGDDSKQVGTLGTTGYVPGRNYGIRITNKGDGKFLLQNLVDYQAEEKTITLAETDLPRGGFGFEFCCGRSFIVANVTVEAFAPTDSGNPLAEFLDQLKQKRQPLDEAQKARASLPSQRPGKIAWTTDVTDKPLQTHVLLRGNYKSPGDPVEPGGFGRLSDHLAADVTDSGEPDTVKSRSIPQESGALRPPVQEVAREKFVPPRGTGRRLAFARWITRPDSSPASLLARVHVNRLWQQHFGTGIVATPDNFGLSGSPPSHPELLDWLAAEFIRSGWSPKRVTRLIVNSAAYRQSSSTDDRRLQLDPDVRRLSRFPVRRLDAEAIRDALLAASGDLDDRLFGPYIPTSRTGSGETVVPEKQPGSVRRSVYLQQKRTQVHSLLQVFDAPSIVFNSTRRPRSTMPLQSLSLLNSEFVTSRARSLANRLNPDESSDSQRIRDLFRIATGRDPTDIQMAAAIKFLMTETAEYAQHSDARRRAWTDLCQMVLISNPALYLD